MVTEHAIREDWRAEQLAISEDEGRAAVLEAKTPDLFEDPAWQAALENEVLVRFTAGGMPI